MTNGIAALSLAFLCILPLAASASDQVASEASPPPGVTSGKVVETMNAVGYTYVHVDTGQEKMWAAAPSFPVSVGDEVVVPPGALMRDFYSKSLDRTFETIYFVAQIRVEGGRPDKATLDSVHAGVSGVASTTELDLGDIAKADGGRTVAEILAEGAALSGQEVTVRGRVVKFMPRILGTNFLHLRDGTTSNDGGTGHLTVTTAATPDVGDLVVVRGLVTTDKDFGHGYKYDLIVENARVSKE